MTSAVSPDIEALRAALAVAEARADEAEARAARVVAEASNAEAIIAALKLRSRSCGVSSTASARSARRACSTSWS